MNSILIGIVIVLLTLIIISVIWHLLSRRYTLPCPSWLAWMVELDNPFTKVNRAATIIEHLDIRDGMHVLDVGCGPGRLTIPAARAVGSEGTVTAIDMQDAMLKRVQEKARKEKLENIIYLHAGIEDALFEPNSFDRILLVTVLGEIPDREKALAKLYDTLKPGGILSITELIFDPHFQRQSTVVRLAQAAGFEKKAVFGNSIAYTMHLTK